MKKSQYKGYYNIVKNEALKEATIFIYGVIGGFDWEEWKFINTADTFLADFKAVEDEYDVINIKINSPGGNVWDGLAIFNAISNSPKTINTYNDGICYSMAALLMLAGDNSYANDNSLFMVHNVISAVWGNAQEMRDEADVLDKYDAALSTAIENKLGISNEKVKANFLNYKDNYYTAKEALNEGFYDKILENKSKNVPENVAEMSPKDLIEHYAKMNFEVDKKETPKTPTSKSDKKPLTMSKSYKNIEKVIGLEFGEGETANGILLTEEQADALENRVGQLETEVATAQTNSTELQNTIDAATTANEAIVNAANEELELEGDAKVTDVAGAIKAYQNKIAELGAKPGSEHTKIKAKEDEDAQHAYIDFESPIYKN